MFTKREANLLKKQLPTNSIIEISTKRNISRPTIYKFFRGEKIRSYHAKAIYEEALEILEREKTETSNLVRKAEEIIFSDEMPLKPSKSSKK